MIEDKLQQLRAAIEQAGLPSATRSQLLELVATVESEAGQGPPRAGEPEPAEVQHGIHRLIAFVDGLEAAHPEMTERINQLALGLSKMGF